MAEVGLTVLGVVAAFAAAGCASNRTTLSLQMKADPYFYTDDASRKLALKTLEKLPELSQNYRIGAEDVLEVSIFEWELREETKSVEVRVAEDGLISLPVIGELAVKGLTVDDVQAKIEQRLREWQIIPNPRVSVVVQQYRSKRVAVVGSVMDPGAYTLRTNVTTLLDILSLAGGPDIRSGQVAYVILGARPATGEPAPASPGQGASANPAAAPGMPSEEAVSGGVREPVSDLEKRLSGPGPGQQPFGFMPTLPGKEVIAIDLYQLMELGDLSLNVILGDGDVVYVPEAKRFFIIGFVRNPGSYPIKKPTTILEGIAVAQGVREEEASVTRCAVKRKTPQGEVIIPVNLRAIAKGDAPNLYLQPEDIIDVRQTSARMVALYIYNTVTRVLNFGFSGRVF